MPANNVIDLANYWHRSNFRAGKKRPQLPFGSVLFCAVCDGESFYLYAEGRVHCANCHAHLENLFVKFETSNGTGEDKPAA